jgi:hypothetical protein
MRLHFRLLSGKHIFVPMSARLIVLFLVGCVSGLAVHAQDSTVKPQPDSIRQVARPRRDSVALAPVAAVDTILHLDSTGHAPAKPPAMRLEAFSSQPGAATAYGNRMEAVFRDHPWCKVLTPVTRVKVLERLPPPTDWIFYLFVTYCLYVGFIRISFPKYLSDLFRVFFNTSLRGKQIREQLLMDRLPSLLLNVFFTLSAGSFIYFLLRYNGYFGTEGHWVALGLCVAGVGLLYTGKYVVMELAGLVFDRRQAAEIYAFVVFMVNKVVGLWLLPVSILLAYSTPGTQHTVLVFAFGGLGILLLYRLNRGWQALRNTLKINMLQYALFVGAFEVVPVLLIYKLLLKFF